MSHPIRHLLETLWVLSFLLILECSGEARGEQDKNQLTLLITSDLHGWLSTSNLYPRQKSKGLLHLEQAIRKARLEDPDAILLDAGDLLLGSPLALYYNTIAKNPAFTNPFFQLVKDLRYDAIVVGNHDLELNPLFERHYVPASNFTWLAANLNKTSPSPFVPYLILRRKGLKIAILGLTTPGVMMWLDPKKWAHFQVTSLSQSINKWVSLIRKQEKPDLLIGIFHVGWNVLRDDENSKLNQIPAANGLISALNKAPPFDLLISGHDHRLFPSRDGQPLTYFKSTPIIGAGYWGEALVRLRLKIHEGQIIQIHHQIFRASQDASIKQQYQEILSPAYRSFLYEKLPWKITTTDKKQLKECLSKLNAIAHLEGVDMGSLFPPPRVKRIRAFLGKQLNRAFFLEWFRYDNKSMTIYLSKRDLQLLQTPQSHSNRRRIPYNRVLYPFYRSFPLPIDYRRTSWWLNKEIFLRRFQIKISDYHFNGGGGLRGIIFWSSQTPIQISQIGMRERLFQFLKRPHRPLPPICDFLKPMPL